MCVFCAHVGIILVVRGFKENSLCVCFVARYGKMELALKERWFKLE
jgi:hypothetical protein